MELAYDIEVPGRTQHLADMMSRSYLPAKGQETYSEFEAVNVVQFLPIGQERLERFDSRPKGTVLCRYSRQPF